MYRIVFIDKHSFDVEVFDGEGKSFIFPDRTKLVFLSVYPFVSAVEGLYDAEFFGYSFKELDCEVMDVVETEPRERLEVLLAERSGLCYHLRHIHFIVAEDVLDF